jgi:di/tripeptidase
VATYEELIQAIREDDEYIKLKKVSREEREKMKITANWDEAMGLLASRPSRNIHAKKQFSPRAVMEAMSCDMSARSRLTEMRTRAKLHADTLEDACDALGHHIRVAYGEELKRHCTTVDARKSFIAKLNQPTLETLSEVDSLIDMLDQVITDIDKTSFHLSKMAELIMFIDSSKGSRNV